MNEFRVLVPDNQRTSEYLDYELVTATADGSICCAGEHLCAACTAHVNQRTRALGSPEEITNQGEHEMNESIDAAPSMAERFQAIRAENESTTRHAGAGDVPRMSSANITIELRSLATGTLSKSKDRDQRMARLLVEHRLRSIPDVQ
jgi:hypothetical protein